MRRSLPGFPPKAIVLWRGRCPAETAPDGTWQGGSMSNAPSKDAVEWTPPAAVLSSRAPHEQDEFGWLLQQAELLRAGRLDEIDRHPLAEYLTDMATSDARALKGALRVLLIHMLKILVQPERLAARCLELFPIEVDRKKSLAPCFDEQLYPTKRADWSDVALECGQGGAPVKAPRAAPAIA